MAGSADVILIPEIPFSFDSIVKKVYEREKNGSLFTNIVVAEGAVEVGNGEIYLDEAELRLGGVGEYIRQSVEKNNRKGVPLCCAWAPSAWGEPKRI